MTSIIERQLVSDSNSNIKNGQIISLMISFLLVSSGMMYSTIKVLNQYFRQALGADIMVAADWFGSTIYEQDYREYLDRNLLAEGGPVADYMMLPHSFGVLIKNDSFYYGDTQSIFFGPVS
jgi:hypothetical protein